MTAVFVRRAQLVLSRVLPHMPQHLCETSGPSQLWLSDVVNMNVDLSPPACNRQCQSDSQSDSE